MITPQLTECDRSTRHLCNNVGTSEVYVETNVASAREEKDKGRSEIVKFA